MLGSELADRHESLRIVGRGWAHSQKLAKAKATVDSYESFLRLADSDSTFSSPADRPGMI